MPKILEQTGVGAIDDLSDDEGEGMQARLSGALRCARHPEIASCVAHIVSIIVHLCWVKIVEKGGNKSLNHVK